MRHPEGAACLAVARYEGADLRFNQDTVHKLVEEANLFIDAAHKAHAKWQMEQLPAAAQI